MAELAAAHPNIVGIKDTVDTISHTRKVIRAIKAVNPRFAVFSGFDEYYLVNRVSGGDGVICGMTNVDPETFVELHRAYEAGDYATAIKGAVKAKGLDISTLIREPAVQLTAQQYEAVKAILNG